MKLTKYPNKILREKTTKVEFPLSDEIKKIADGMISHIDESQTEESKLRAGIGIAAPQVGHSLKMFYVNVPEDSNSEGFKEFLINPEIIGHSERYAALSTGEGCLSVDFEDERTQGLVHRYNKIIIKGYSYLQEKEVTITKVGYHAIVLQHEYDHLMGKLFIDRINKKTPWAEKTNEVLI